MTTAGVEVATVPLLVRVIATTLENVDSGRSVIVLVIVDLAMEDTSTKLECEIVI